MILTKSKKKSELKKLFWKKKREKKMEEQNDFRMPLIGDDAPAFTAKTTQGEINFPADYKGKWVILFSHPADFTPVCTTEFMTFASMQEDFKKLTQNSLGFRLTAYTLILHG